MSQWQGNVAKREGTKMWEAQSRVMEGSEKILENFMGCFDVRGQWRSAQGLELGGRFCLT